MTERGVCTRNGSASARSTRQPSALTPEEQETSASDRATRAPARASVTLLTKTDDATALRIDIGNFSDLRQNRHRASPDGPQRCARLVTAADARAKIGTLRKSAMPKIATLRRKCMHVPGSVGAHSQICCYSDHALHNDTNGTVRETPLASLDIIRRYRS